MWLTEAQNLDRTGSNGIGKTRHGCCKCQDAATDPLPVARAINIQHLHQAIALPSNASAIPRRMVKSFPLLGRVKNSEI